MMSAYMKQAKTRRMMADRAAVMRRWSGTVTGEMELHFTLLPFSTEPLEGW